MTVHHYVGVSWWLFYSIGRYNSIMRHKATSFLTRIMRIDLSVDNRFWTIATRSLSLSSVSISRNSYWSVPAWPWLPNLNFSVAAFIHSSSTSLMTSLSALVTSLEVGQTNDNEFWKRRFQKRIWIKVNSFLYFCFRREFSKRLFFIRVIETIKIIGGQLGPIFSQNFGLCRTIFAPGLIVELQQGNVFRVSNLLKKQS